MAVKTERFAIIEQLLAIETLRVVVVLSFKF